MKHFVGNSLGRWWKVVAKHFYYLYYQGVILCVTCWLVEFI